MCAETMRCMKVGPTESTLVCVLCYEHPCCESLIDDMFQSHAYALEMKCDQSYIEVPRRIRFF